jgi:simple sugar transport system permease protein
MTLYFIGNGLDYFALLLTAAVGAQAAFRGGLFNLGLDGQIYVGALAASCVLLGAPQAAQSGAVLLLGAAAAILTGAAMGWLCAFLKNLTGASELITTFLLSAALTPLADYIIQAFLRDPTGNLLASRQFPANLRLFGGFFNSNLSISLGFALILPFLSYYFLNKTAVGYRFRIAGDAPDFARYGGINVKRYAGPALGISGGLGGLCGFFAVAGSYGMCYEGFTGGLGWAAIAVSLIAKNRCLALIPAALFYTALKSGADAILLDAGMSFEASSLLQALVLLIATVQLGRNAKNGAQI